MYILYRYNILPENRINNSTNPSLYAIRFKELEKKSFYFNNDRLYYIKKCETVRYDDGSFENKDNVILKKIPYIYEILPSIDHIHDIYGHISFRNLSKKLLSTNFFIDNIDILTQKYTKEFPECYSNFHSKQIIKRPKVIKAEGPHYRLLAYFTYLDQKYYNGRTKYKYIIDAIDHFSKFYLGFLTEDKSENTSYQKIKLFILINKKPVFLQTDNGLEFRNKLLSEYLENEGIKHILSRPHHPQTNCSLERYHREVKKYMKEYLDNINHLN